MIQSDLLPLGCAKGNNDKFLHHPQEATDVRDWNSSRRLDVSRSDNLPRCFEGMLKTTTETGDIGMFSIKPSRLPQSSNTLRRPNGAYDDNGKPRTKQPFQSYGNLRIDDRRRLPSYSRDTLETMSMYDSGSQKSISRVYDGSDSRSLSMTHTSHSSYTLSNHKSYASLRSQQDTPRGTFVGVGGVLQRPRSPFAYPTRLRRPGFRPSSPALTDGGIVDYSRRAEIERFALTAGYSSSSPTSLYAMRRKPPLTLRPEGNITTPSSFGQNSPLQRSSSPQAFISTGNERACRNGIASINTSPARSTFSLAPTTNLRAPATASSVTTTPGRLPPASPLYYDYTEDFEDNEYRPVELSLPPLFTIHKTIPEDRPMSSHSSATEVANSNSLRISLPPHMNRLSVGESLLNWEEPINSIRVTDNRVDAASESSLGLSSAPASGLDETQDGTDFRLSYLGNCARELNSRVGEAFRLDPSSPFEISLYKVADRSDEVSNEQMFTGLNQYINVSNIVSSKVSRADVRCTSSSLKLTRDVTGREQQQQSDDLALQKSQESNDYLYHSHRVSQQTIVRTNIPAHSSFGHPHRRSITDGFPTLDVMSDVDGTILPSTSESTRPHASEATARRLDGTHERNIVVPHTSLLQVPKPEHGFAPPSSLSNDMSVAELSSIAQAEETKGSGGNCLQLPSPNLAYRPSHLSDLSHQTRRPPAPQESPMFAPKPISPARQLKLKNSIPQLMKALPPLPAEPKSQKCAPEAHQISIGCDMPHQTSRITMGITPVTAQELCETLAVTPSTLSLLNTDEMARFRSLQSNLQSKSEHPKSVLMPQQETTLPPPRLRLKLKAPSSLQPQSCSEEDNWNMGESNSRDNQDSSPIFDQTEHENKNKHTRFKLRLTRSSLKEQGTIRINRSKSSPENGKAAVGLILGTPMDLFSPTLGIESLFRKVSKHMHSRKPSVTSSLGPERNLDAVPSLVPNLLDTEGTYLLEPTEIQVQPPSIQMALLEAQSCFSDDSSQEEGQDSLHRRLTSLKSQLPVPYVSRAGFQSCDNITWKDRNDGEAPIPAAARSIPNLHDYRTSPDAKPMRRFVERLHRQRLKAKMQGWLNGVRAVIAEHVKPRSAACTTD